MKPYGNNRLMKNKILMNKNITEKTGGHRPLKNYITIGKKLNYYTIYEEKKKEYIENSIPTMKSYNPSNSYFSHYQKYKTENPKNYNNHSLYDSNKQKVIKTENNSKNMHNIRKGENSYKNSNAKTAKNNKICICSLRNLHLSHKKEKFFNEFDRKNKFDNKSERKVNSNKSNTRNYEFNKNYKDIFNHRILYTSNNSKDKSLDKSTNSNNYIKASSIKQLNKNNNLTNNKEVQRRNQNNSKNYVKLNIRNIINNKYSTEKNSEEKYKNSLLRTNYINKNTKSFLNKNPNTNKESHSPSFIKTKIDYSPDKYSNYNYQKRNKISFIERNNKTNDNFSINLKEDKLKEIMPIKLNIEYANKEKLSRLKRIIEKSSKNHNFYKIEFPNDETNPHNNNKVIKSSGKKRDQENYNKNNSNLIFKKKKIENITKNIRVNRNNNLATNKKYENNFLITSSIIKNKMKNKLVLYNINNKTKDNNNIQSLVAQYNLNRNKTNENKLSSKETDQTSYIKKKKEKKYMIYNNDDTISLSYSKERDSSISSKEKQNDEISISLPFLIEHFNIYYDINTKKLIKNDKYKNNYNVKKNFNFENNDSEDDDYQLTKEIILLKKGLSKKNNINKDIIKTITNKLRPERNFKVTLFGNKKIYMKKNYWYVNLNSFK